VEVVPPRQQPQDAGFDGGRQQLSKLRNFPSYLGFGSKHGFEMNLPDEQAASGGIAPSGEAIPERYVAFCDILGFSNRIMTDFEQTLNTYRKFGEALAGAPLQDVEVTIYSDSVLLVGESLPKVLTAVQMLWFFALAHDFMLRGAITKGHYWQLKKGNHLLVASDALVRAVKLEHSVGAPAVFIADDIEIPDSYYLSLLYYIFVIVT
jgi:hypothetical protein